MAVVAWWMAAVVVLACLLLGPIQRGSEALARRRQARLRAEALLLAWLSPGQRAQYRARGWFEVTTAAGHRYRVRRGGIVRLDPRGSAYCIEAVSAVPVADEMLANKLLLETDERRFLATAHRYRDTDQPRRGRRRTPTEPVPAVPHGPRRIGKTVTRVRRPGQGIV